MQSIEEIEYRLLKAGCPQQLITKHCGRVEKWRKAHPKKIRRHRIYDDQPVSASGHAQAAAFARTRSEGRYSGFDGFRGDDTRRREKPL